MRMQLSHLVLRASEPERLASFYEALGLRFTREKHGRGPEHVSTRLGEALLEIYPLATGHKPTSGLRLGFAVSNVRAACEAALQASGELVTLPVEKEWGCCATLRDPEGHLLDLVETPNLRAAPARSPNQLCNTPASDLPTDNPYSDAADQRLEKFHDALLAGKFPELMTGEGSIDTPIALGRSLGR